MCHKHTVALKPWKLVGGERVAMWILQIWNQEHFNFAIIYYKNVKLSEISKISLAFGSQDAPEAATNY